MIVVLWPGQERCVDCRSNLDKAGFQIEDRQGTRQFVCLAHLVEMLRAKLTPLRIIGTEA